MLATAPAPPPIISIDDELLGSGKLGKLLGGVSPATICRYETQGLVIDGYRLKLPSIRIGGKRYSTRAAVNWWVAEQQRIEQANTASFDPRRRTDEDDDLDRETEAELNAIADREGL